MLGESLLNSMPGDEYLSTFTLLIYPCSVDTLALAWKFCRVVGYEILCMRAIFGAYFHGNYIIFMENKSYQVGKSSKKFSFTIPKSNPKNSHLKKSFNNKKNPNLLQKSLMKKIHNLSQQRTKHALFNFLFSCNAPTQSSNKTVFLMN